MDRDLGMGWSWPDLQATPEYTKQNCLMFLQMKHEAKEKAAKAERG